MSTILVNDVPSCRSCVARLDDSFLLESGRALSDHRLGFTRYGPPDAPTVLVLGGISAGRDIRSTGGPARGWWEEFVGPGAPVDTGRFHVLGLDYLGGAGISGGPAWSELGDPADAGGAVERRGIDVPIPEVTPRDQAAAVVALLDWLEIPHLYACVGSSYGGMVALALAERWPERVERIVAISAAHRPHPMATALRCLQRRIVQAGMRSGAPRDGLVLARSLAMTTYRSAEEFDRRFPWRPLADGGNSGFRGAGEERSLVFPVESYLSARGEDFADRFSPRAFLCLSQSIDLQDVDPRRVEVPATLISVDRDTLVPVWQVAELARSLGGRCRHDTLSSIYGHDAFLKEREALTGLLYESLNRREVA